MSMGNEKCHRLHVIYHKYALQPIENKRYTSFREMFEYSILTESYCEN